MTDPRPGFTAADAVDLLRSATGDPYRLVGRLAGGETGAHEIAGPDDERLVIKWDLDPDSQALRRRAVQLTRRLGGDAGWPVPAQRTVDADGCLLVIQDLVAGRPVERLTHAVADRLLVLHAARLGLGVGLGAEIDRPWSTHLVETLTVGGGNYCLHEPLRAFDARCAHFVDAVERLGADLDASALPSDDIVHWDLHPGNLLQVDGELTAVIDNDFVIVGDAAFDLVTIALASTETPYDEGVQNQLFAAAFDGVERPRRDAYVAHILLRVLDWAVRRGRTEEIPRWLDQADRLLFD